MANTTVTQQMYEENSFLRDRRAMSFLVHILDTLNDYNVCLESSLTRGLDIWNLYWVSLLAKMAQHITQSSHDEA